MAGQRRLEAWSINRALPGWERGIPRPLIDLSSVQYLDAFALAFLRLYLRRCQEAGGRVRVLLPLDEGAAHSLARAGIFRGFGECVWTDRPPPKEPGEDEGFLTMARVEEEREIRGLVERMCDALEARFPLGKHSIRVLAGAMLELAQNIPHHADPLGEGLDPFGLLAVQELSDHIHLAVMDKGVGLHRSLSLNPRYRSLDERGALEAVLIRGASRFGAPGRGGALRRIREVVQANEGRMLVRSGKVAFWQAEVEWGVEEVHPFPGVQISIQLPRALFFG